VARRRAPTGGCCAGPVLAVLLVWPSAPILAAEAPPPTNSGDWGHAIAALVIFGVLLAILGRFGWKPLLAQLRRREESIAEALRTSQQREAEAQELLKFYRTRMERAEADAAEVVGRGRREAAEARENALGAAREEATKIAAQTRQDIAAAKEAALRELRVAAAELAVDLAERVLGKSLTDTDHAQLVDESLAEIRRQGKGGA
jgi:F-type H+-transporting ATPase subunit b